MDIALLILSVGIGCFALGYGIGWGRSHKMWRDATYQRELERWQHVYEKAPPLRHPALDRNLPEVS